jgi:Fe-S-cluster containining protein
MATSKILSKTREPRPTAVVAVTELSKADRSWWKEGIRFECQGSGKCCVSHDQYGFVYMTTDDRKSMAKHLGLTLAAFTKKHCDETDGFFHLKESGNPSCMFLKNKQCTVYEARPVQCRTWPFWPEVMKAKVWKAEVAAFCPGIGKGRVWSADEINALLDEQTTSENQG